LNSEYKASTQLESRLSTPNFFDNNLVSASSFLCAICPCSSAVKFSLSVGKRLAGGKLVAITSSVCFLFVTWGDGLGAKKPVILPLGEDTDFFDVVFLGGMLTSNCQLNLSEATIKQWKKQYIALP